MRLLRFWHARPLIGVTASGNMDFPAFLNRQILRLLGLRVRKLSPRHLPKSLNMFDGYILSGGDDIHPSEYGQQPDPSLPPQPYDPVRDRLERQILEDAVAHRKPVMGICRGMQMINVFFGGSLHADIKMLVEEARYPSSLIGKIFFRKRVQVLDSTAFAEIFKMESFKVNSLHHQAVDKLGYDLIIAVTEGEVIVQALEHRHKPYIFGVQWHPELIAWRPSQLRLFRHFKSRIKFSKTAS